MIPRSNFLVSAKLLILSLNGPCGGSRSFSQKKGSRYGSGSDSAGKKSGSGSRSQSAKYRGRKDGHRKRSRVERSKSSSKSRSGSSKSRSKSRTVLKPKLPCIPNQGRIGAIRLDRPAGLSPEKRFRALNSKLSCHRGAKLLCLESLVPLQAEDAGLGIQPGSVIGLILAGGLSIAMLAFAIFFLYFRRHRSRSAVREIANADKLVEQLTESPLVHGSSLDSVVTDGHDQEELTMAEAERQVNKLSGNVADKAAVLAEIHVMEMEAQAADNQAREQKLASKFQEFMDPVSP